MAKEKEPWSRADKIAMCSLIATIFFGTVGVVIALL